MKKRLRVVCNEEEHVGWGKSETVRLLVEKPWLRTPYYGLLQLQLMVAPIITRAFEKRFSSHAVLAHVPAFVDHVRVRVWAQGQRLGFVSKQRLGVFRRSWAIFCGLALYLRSQCSRSQSHSDKRYLQELGFTGS